MMRALALGVVTASSVWLAPALADAATVTVLITLEPTKFSGKPWDIEPGADPILCMQGGCYVSAGLSVQARFEPERQALLPLNVMFTQKAGACGNTLTCVLRGIELSDTNAIAQPVDLDFAEHDRLEPSRLGPDKTCRVEDGALGCYEGIYTREYSMWVVPEAVAAEAGPELLEQAVTTGMREGRKTFAEESLSETREQLPEALGALYGLILDETIGNTCKRDPQLLSDTFRLAGLTDNARAGLDAEVVADYVTFRNPEAQIAMLHDHPASFWALHDAVQRLIDMAGAETARPDPGSDRLVLDRSGDRPELVVGGDARAIAEALIERCKIGRHAGAGSGVEIWRKG